MLIFMTCLTCGLMKCGPLGHFRFLHLFSEENKTLYEALNIVPCLVSVIIHFINTKSVHVREESDLHTHTLYKTDFCLHFLIGLSYCPLSYLLLCFHIKTDTVLLLLLLLLKMDSQKTSETPMQTWPAPQVQSFWDPVPPSLKKELFLVQASSPIQLLYCVPLTHKLIGTHR